LAKPPSSTIRVNTRMALKRSICQAIRSII
jgi:hypothetical protein